MTVAQIIPHVISGVQIFPSNNIWNRPILDLPVHAQSGQWITSVDATLGVLYLYLKTSTDGSHGIPYNLVTNSTPTYSTTLTYAAETYTGAFPIPASPLYEEAAFSSDHHLICLNTDSKVCYEMTGYDGTPGGSGSGAWAWDLTSNVLPTNFSGQEPVAASAAATPMIAGLVFYDEIAAGKITHALYVCVPRGSGYGNEIWPAKHNDGNIDGSYATPPLTYPPQGTRFRLKASVDISGYSTVNQVVLTALKTYGAFNCDSNSGEVRMQGVPDSRWNLTDLANLNNVHSTDFEIVDESGVMVSSLTAQATGVRAFSKR
jgi:hypothetical protein